jgi:WD40 repeat protein
MGFLELRCRDLGLPAVERALQQAAAKHGGVVAAIHRALRADAHWLSRDIAALPTQIYNRLRCSGWDAAEIDRELLFSAGRPALHLRHPVHMHDAELTLEGHQEGIWACAVSPDGRRVISASRDRTLRVWDLQTGEALAVLQGHDAEVRGCAWVPDGRRLVSASADGTLRIWDLEAGRALVTLAGHEHRVLACAVTQDGQRIVSASSDRRLRIWDAQSGETQAILAGHGHEVRDCAVTPDGRCVVSVSKDGSLRIWSLQTGEALATLQGSHGCLTSCAMSPDGTRVVVSADGEGRRSSIFLVWSLETRKIVATFRGHTHLVKACVVTRDGRHVISAAMDQTVRVWELATGREVAKLQGARFGHTDLVLDFAVTPNGRHVINASWDGSLRVWSLNMAFTPAPATEATRAHSSITPTLDGQRIVSSPEKGALQVVNLDTGKVLARITVRDPTMSGGRVVAVGDRRAVVQQRDSLQALDLETGREIATLAVGEVKVDTHAMVAGDRWVVFCEPKARGLHVWDLDRGQVLTLIEAQALGCMTTRAQRCASIDESIVVWDETGRIASTPEQPAGCGGIILASTLDGQHLVTASLETAEIYIRETTTGRVAFTLAVEASPWGFPRLARCAVTPDGRRLIATCLGASPRVWDMRTGTLIATIHIEAGVHSVAATNQVFCVGDFCGNLWVFDAPPLGND